MTGPRSGLVAVLFTDLVGSTELMSQLGDRAFDDLRRRHFAALAKAVAAHGGEEVKNTGDGLMATFPSAAEAVEAAVAMQQATARQAVAAPMAIRVGVAVGDATFEGGDYFGTPVVEAARLVAAARPGQILVTKITQALAGTRCAASFTDIGPLNLKGLPKPVVVCEVGWQPIGSPVPMPTLLTDVGRIFVGRDADLERLGQLWKEAAAGERRVALLAGEPGVGKTRLAAELATGANEGGGTVLAGRCDEDLGVPYQPFVEALRHYMDHTPAGDLGERLGRHGGELQRLVPELAQLVPALPAPLRSDPETERYRLFDAVAAWLAAASGQEPLLLVLDDLQWAAKPTLLLLRHVLLSPEGMSLLVLATYRDSDIGRGHPLAGFLADLRKEHGVERVALTGLDDSGVADFLVQAAGHELDEAGEELARAVRRETEGNPFFVGEVLRHLAESGAVEQREGRWVVTAAVDELGIPEGVRDVVGRRLSRLSEDANRLLACAAVAGLEFEPAVVQTAGGFDEDLVLSALEEALAARLLIETAGSVPRNRFAHALVRAALYDELTAPRRVALHRRVAEAIETLHAGALDDYLPALAHHWARASAPTAETTRAVDYAIRAGDRALTQLAHDEAATYYRQALDLLEVTGVPATDPRRIELLISLGQAQLRSGDPAHRQTLLDAAQLAEQAGDVNVFARAALANYRGIFSVSGAVDAERVAVLERVLETLDRDDSPDRARLLAHLAAELSWSPDHVRREELVAEALAMARRLGDPATLAEMLTARVAVLVMTAERYEEALELTELANRSRDPALLFWAQFISSTLALTVGDVHTYVVGLEEAERRANELGQPTGRWAVAMHQSVSHRRAGRLEDAEALARRALDVGQAAGLPDAEHLFDSYSLFWIRYDQGRLDELVEHFERRVASSGLQSLVGNLGVIYGELGRLNDARRILDRLAADTFAMLPRNFVWLYELTVAAQITVAVGDRVRAAQLYHLLLPYRELVAQAGSSATGGIVHYLALLSSVLGRFDEADAGFEAAARLHQRLAAPIWLARTRLEWARMLLTRRRAGDPDRARTLADQALATARGLGLAKVERDAVALLQ